MLQVQAHQQQRQQQQEQAIALAGLALPLPLLLLQGGTDLASAAHHLLLLLPQGPATPLVSPQQQQLPTCLQVGCGQRAMWIQTYAS
jgi:hypothetical protein